MLNAQTARPTLETVDGREEVIHYLRQRIRYLTRCMTQATSGNKKNIYHTARGELIMIHDMLTGASWFANEDADAECI